MPALSITIIAKNEATRIERALASVRPLGTDIVVLDSGSTDGTQALCRELGARVIQTDWPGYGVQKNRAVDAALNDWVLCLDADEQVTPELAEAIRAALVEPRAFGYRIARCNRFLGRELRHGEGFPDYCLRLFDRRRGRWSEACVHEQVRVDGEVGTLAGVLMHDSAESLSSYIDKQNRYSDLAARQAVLSGQRATAAHLVLSPLLRFIKFYLLRRGFLDGVPGLIHVAIGCFASFMKYAKMREIQQRAKPEGR